MRNYIRGYWMECEEKSVSLGITLHHRVWRRDEEGIDEAIAQFEKQVDDAGGDWTFSITFPPTKRWWEFGRSKENDLPVIEELLETYFHGLPQASNAFDDVMMDNFDGESPRRDGYNSKTEKVRRSNLLSNAGHRLADV